MPCTHWINPTTGTALIIDPEVVKELLYIGLESSKESGGVIIDQRGGKHFLIQQITLPKTADIRHRFSIQKSANGHVQDIERAINVSEGKLCYLCEWHTHPQKRPIPSETDITT
jgi:integrative and conjugative element protein (TIGR02256 family)